MCQPFDILLNACVVVVHRVAVGVLVRDMKRNKGLPSGHVFAVAMTRQKVPHGPRRASRRGADDTIEFLTGLLRVFMGNICKDGGIAYIAWNCYN